MRLSIAGLGPAGAVLAMRAVARGYRVTACDPAVAEGDCLPLWPATYGVLAADVPPWAESFFHPSFPLHVCTPTVRTLPFSYRMANKQALRDAFREAVAAGLVEVVRDARPDCDVDCSGAPRTDEALWQFAYGEVVDFSCGGDATPTPAPTPLFMDWRCSLGAADDGAPPSFCYIQPLGDGRWLWEETILSTHAPADPDRHAEFYRVLERRLHHRRNQDPTAYGCDQVQGSETVAIPMGTRKGTLPHHFGAAGGAINPATGYSLGASLSDADMLLDELGRPSGVRGCVRRANRALAYLLRQLGGELIAQASHETCLSFFDAFFALPARHQLAYLTGHNGVAVAATMWALRKNTGFAHPFLMPLWKKPLTVAAAVRRRMRNS